MAFSVGRMGKKLGLVGTPRIRAAAANIRSDLCLVLLQQKYRHLTTETQGLSKGGGESNEKALTTDKTLLYKGYIVTTIGVGLLAYLEYTKSDIKELQDEAYRKYDDALSKHIKEQFAKARLERAKARSARASLEELMED